MTALWCCKESVSKALGLGLKLRVSDMIIESFELDDRPGLKVQVELRRDAMDAMIDQHSRQMEVRLFIEDDFVVAVAQGIKQEGVSRALSDAQRSELVRIMRDKTLSVQKDTVSSSSSSGVQGVVWRH